LKENNIDRIDGLASLIGNTPVLAIEYLFRGKKGQFMPRLKT
jgi:hypothetical protein